ncbi:MAG: DNA recombination protein RmuC [Bacteroidales bacterium]
MYILIGIEIVLLLVIIILLIRKKQENNFSELNSKLDFIDKNAQRLESLMRDEFMRNRVEQTQTLTSFSDLLTKSVGNMSSTQKEQFENFSLRVKELSESFNDRFKVFQEQINVQLKDNKEDLTRSLKVFQDSFNQSVKDFNDIQIQKFSDLILKQEQLRQETEQKLEKIRETVEKKLEFLQQENSKKLEEMRATVDEKLQNTLEKRLSESFKVVSERLEQVHRGLGEMQSLASDVGDLKKVLSNVKQRGVIGEIQLGAILENILSPGQYQKNVKTKSSSDDFVEYAIVLPGKDESGKPVYLPIDSKFPIEDYLRLVEAYEKANPVDIKASTTNLQNAIRKSAKDIHDKYIDPPNTTDFGILFLPVEGLYAEVIRQTGLIEELSRTYKIIISGPTTLAALLNSLQMGFRTLAIEKRSSEVWKVLQAVKTEFGKFEDVLIKAKEKIDKAGDEIEKLVGTRTRVIKSKLKNLTELPEDEVKSILDTNNVESPDETTSDEN